MTSLSKTLLFNIFSNETLYPKLKRFFSLSVLITCICFSFYGKMPKINHYTEVYFNKGCHLSPNNCSKKEQQKFLNSVGTVAREGLVIIPIAIGVITASPSYLLQYAVYLSSSYMLSEITKNVVGKQRPDASNNKSFPSGHAVSVFCAATFMLFRHGILTSIPFYLIACVIAFTRIYDKKHDIFDVIGGVALPFLTMAILVSIIKYSSKNQSQKDQNSKGSGGRKKWN